MENPMTVMIRRHTFATWMRRAGADVQGLIATGNWKDLRSAARYAHAVASDEWGRVDRLPAVTIRDKKLA
jgi:site-specific recombinase XerD